MKAWIEHNSHSFRLALERLLASPFASLVSVLVIGVAASLPTSLYVLLANAERAASGMQERPEVTLFLKMEAGREDGQQLARDWRAGKTSTRPASSTGTVYSALPAQCRNIDIDLSQTHFLDSCGLGALISLRKTASRRNGTVRLLNPSPRVQLLFDVTRMHRVFEIVTR